MGQQLCCTVHKEDRYVALMETLKHTGSHFHDSEFPAGPESLVQGWEQHILEGSNYLNEWQHIQWTKLDRIACLNEK